MANMSSDLLFADERVQTDERTGDMLLPINVEGLRTNKGLSVKQAIALIGIAVLWIAGLRWFSDTRLANTWYYWLVAIAICALISQWVLRFIVFNEKYMIAQYKEQQKFKNMSPSLAWGVAAISKKSRVVTFTDGRLGLIVKLEQATIVGVDAEFRKIHYSEISDFFKELDHSGLSWVHLNIMASTQSDNRMAVVQNDISNCEISSIRQWCRTVLGHIRQEESNTLYETEYYMIIGSNRLGEKGLTEAIGRAVFHLEQAAYNRVTIPTKVQCYELLGACLGVSVFTADDLMKNAARLVSGTKRVMTIKSISCSPFKDEAGMKEILGSDMEVGDTETLVKVEKKQKGMGAAAYAISLIASGKTTDSFEDCIKKRNSIINNNSVRKQHAKVQAGVKEDSGISDEVSFGLGANDVEDLAEYVKESIQEAEDANAEFNVSTDVTDKYVERAEEYMIDELIIDVGEQERQAQEEHLAEIQQQIEDERARKVTVDDMID